MKKILFTIVSMVAIAVLSGCGTMTPQEQAALQNAFRSMNAAIQQQQQQRMYEAQYNYYTRPYELDGVLYIPSRR